MSQHACRPSDPTELFLRHLFRRATTAALLGAAVAQAGACVQASPANPNLGGLNGGGTGGGSTGGENGGGSGNTGGSGTNGGASTGDGGSGDPLTSACADFPLALDAGGVTPVEPVDYLALRERHGFGGEPTVGDAWIETSFAVRSETGTPCASATDGQCATKVALHPEAFTATQCVQICTELSVVTTAGDVVSHYAGPERVMELLGEVDTLDEAALLVESRGYSVCGGRVADDGELRIYATKITNDCAPITTTTYELVVDADGSLTTLRSADVHQENACIGRKPAQLESRARVRGGSRLGDYLAHCAHLEDASVYAFEQLAQDLSRLGAPASLVERARQAAGDERRHAEVVGQLASARGGVCERARVQSPPPRSLEEVARENAVEGCVRETFGAVVGAHQAACAGDRELAVAMAGIAEDELRHAALSWDVHVWALTRLDAAAQARVQRAQHAAVEALRSDLLRESDPELVARAGLPARGARQALFGELKPRLWGGLRAA